MARPDLVSGIARALFTGLVDDAALFPPREATMMDALRGHAAHRAGRHGFLQGPFVVPARRVRELLEIDREIKGSLRLSVTVDYADVDAAVADVVAALSDARATDVSVVMVEMRLPSADVPMSDLRRACDALSALRSDAGGLDVFIESSGMLTSPGEPNLLADTIVSLRSTVAMFVGAKLRTGGLTDDAVPSSELVARFIAAMRDRGVPWKATAGLHHPVRGVHGGRMMHGFLNVLAAALAANARALSDGQLVTVLEDAHHGDFRLTDEGFAWRDVSFDRTAIARARREALRSFGSCSFEEPVDGLCGLGMLP